jgi:hypothetical protein
VAVRGLEGIHLADRRLRHGSWATFIRVSHARAKSEILTL